MPRRGLRKEEEDAEEERYGPPPLLVQDEARRATPPKSLTSLLKTPFALLIDFLRNVEF